MYIVCYALICICASDMEIEFILCVIKDFSSEWDSQILLFVVVNIITILFLGGVCHE